MPSPFGRDMDSQEDLEVHGATEKAPDEQVTGYAGGDTRFQLLARLHNPVEGIGLVLKADLGDDPDGADGPHLGARSSPGRAGTSARRGRCSASSSRAIPT